MLPFQRALLFHARAAPATELYGLSSCKTLLNIQQRSAGKKPEKRRGTGGGIENVITRRFINNNADVVGGRRRR